MFESLKFYCSFVVCEVTTDGIYHGCFFFYITCFLLVRLLPTINVQMNQSTTFSKRLHVRPTKTQISLRIGAVCSEILQDAIWLAKDPTHLLADAQVGLRIRCPHMQSGGNAVPRTKRNSSIGTK